MTDQPWAVSTASATRPIPAGAQQWLRGLQVWVSMHLPDGWTAKGRIHWSMECGAVLYTVELAEPTMGWWELLSTPDEAQLPGMMRAYVDQCMQATLP